ncbi:hypothetical protein [Parvibaculum sp.]|uniref:hypothetical protein n=1 Tax=Parvibaculum sp. TaxID=2024848 RepID=UPI002C048322|nr:hypothetical protein [Parvibaculum sp.]HUD52610.1 hypothetical protein [Parvibaculum sp.]
MKSRLLIYGVDTWQGALISRRAAASLPHIGAGREIARVAGHANETGAGEGENRPVEPRIFGLGDRTRIASLLDDVSVLLNCASSDAGTAAPLIDVCLETGTHYLDLGGDRAHIAALLARHDEAVKAGVVLVPGASFDFAAANAVAARLATILPTARGLMLAVKRSGRSAAEARALVAALHLPGETIRNGQLTPAEPGARVLNCDFGQGAEAAQLAPWRGEGLVWRRRGPYSTIETYEVLPPVLVRLLKRGSLAGAMLRRGWGLKRIERRLTRGREGPTDAELARSRATVWGEARTPDGKVARARLETPAAAIYTADAALLIARALMESGAREGGFYLPSDIAGAGLVEGIEGVVWREIAEAAEAGLDVSVMVGD